MRRREPEPEPEPEPGLNWACPESVDTVYPGKPIVFANLLELLELVGRQAGLLFRLYLLDPSMQRALRHSKFLRNLRRRLVAGSHQLHRLPFELLREESPSPLGHLSPHSGS